jgi:hypothetical protein
MATLVVVRREGSIDSLFPKRSPLRGFSDVALLQQARFPSKTMRHKTFFTAKPMQSFLRQILLRTVPDLRFRFSAK